LTTNGSLALRTAGPADTELLYQIYASTREDELAVVPWDAPAKEAFLRMQFAAQDSHYRASYPAASYDLIVSDDEVFGRMYVDRGAQAWLVLDLALLPAHRGRGIGTSLLTRLQADAAAAGKPVRLHVERFNDPARRLYGRLNFRQVADEGVHLLLEWQPEDG
jgi:ribosomal protein S18 acetylase RimI-like enzyme